MSSLQVRNRHKVMWVSDSPVMPHVGQSRVGREVIERLKKDFDVCVAGYYAQDAVGSESIYEDIPIYNIVRGQTKLLVKAIEKFNPDIIILSHDVFEFPKLAELKIKFPDKKFVGYFTIDGDPIDVRWIQVLEACHEIWSPTEYGKKTIKERLFWLDVEVIPYGVDTHKFTPYLPVQKEQVKNASPQLKGKFIGLYVGQNHGRKNLSCALEGWAKFAQDKSDVGFIVITHSREVKNGEWGKQKVDYDLKQFYHPTIYMMDRVLDDNSLLQHMQVSDVFVFPTIGEGFGCPISESMACGVVPIVTDFSGHTDFCTNDTSILLTEGVELYSNMWMSKRMIVSSDEVAEKLQWAYENKNSEEFTNKRLKGVETIRSKYNWDVTGYMMKDRINAIMFKDYKSRINKVYEV